MEPLGDRIKTYEKEFNDNINPDEYFIIRLDGKNFSKFTKGFYKPFDPMFKKAMCMTVYDLIKKFDAQTGYTHSDEITLIFDKAIPSDENTNDKHIYCHIYNGRVQKLISLTASYCTVRFNHNLNVLMDTYDGKQKYNDNFVELVKQNEQIFDARILKFEETTKHEILNHQIWRSVHDCERNAVQSYAYCHVGHKNIMNKHCGEMKEMLLEKNIDWNNIPIYIKHGIYCKKMLVEKEINGNVVTRAEYIFKMFKISFSEKNIEMLLSKYWTDTDNQIKLNEII